MASERFPDGFAVADYIRDYDSRAKELSRKRVPTLRDLEREALAKAGQQRILGLTGNHDELVRSILEMEFPHIREAHQARADMTRARLEQA